MSWVIRTAWTLRISSALCGSSSVFRVQQQLAVCEEFSTSSPSVLVDISPSWPCSTPVWGRRYFSSMLCRGREVVLAHKRVGRKVPFSRQSPDHRQGEWALTVEHLRGVRLGPDQAGEVLLPKATGPSMTCSIAEIGSGASIGQHSAS